MTRKISSLNIVPLIDILLVLFVVLMVIGRFEDDDLVNRDEIIETLSITISQKDKKIEELSKKNQTNSSLIEKQDAGKEKLEELLAKNKKLDEELKKIKEQKEALQRAAKEENKKPKKEKYELSIVCEATDTYVVNGKRMSLNDVLFLNDVFGGFGLINYQWYEDNQESVEAKNIFIQKANIKQIK